jgi:hypothetical protein
MAILLSRLEQYKRDNVLDRPHWSFIPERQRSNHSRRRKKDVLLDFLGI